MSSWRSEAWTGLTEARRYLLSHHDSEAWDRCHAIDIPGTERPVRICARCSGIYPGIALGAAFVITGTLPVVPWLVAVLPAFALLDWSATRFTSHQGTNATRTATGFGLGLGYGMGLVAVVRGESRIAVLLVGAVYALLATGGLWLAHGRS
jgi:uncharacterized membrane protein